MLEGDFSRRDRIAFALGSSLTSDDDEAALLAMIRRGREARTGFIGRRFVIRDSEAGDFRYIVQATETGPSGSLLFVVRGLDDNEVKRFLAEDCLFNDPEDGPAPDLAPVTS